MSTIATSDGINPHCTDEGGRPAFVGGLSVAESVRRVGRLIEALGRVPRTSDARAPESWPLPRGEHATAAAATNSHGLA